MENNIIYAFILTLLAGLCTGIGSLIAFFANKTNKAFLSFSLGFSAGVMIYISFVEILPESIEIITKDFKKFGEWYAILAFIGGILLSLIIDKLVPEKINPHEMRFAENMNEDIKKQRLHRVGIITAIAITLHNFPEGIATFITAYSDLELGIAVAIAVAIHNIPEGIAVAVPIYYATGSRKKAFKWSFLSGLAEPLGAVLAFLIIMPFLTNLIFGIVLASVAGIMIFISFDELLPAAKDYGKDHHIATYGVILGILIMAITLIIL